jgi:hypothetical protein
VTTFSRAGRVAPAALSRLAVLREHPVSDKLGAAVRGVTAVLREVPVVLREVAPVVRQAPAVLREAPSALRPVRLDAVPAGWEHQAFDPATGDADALTWLGFAVGGDDEPILAWPRPERWPAGRRAGRHRAEAPLQTA